MWSKPSPALISVFARAGSILLIVLVSFLLLEGAYRLYKYVRYGMVDYLDLVTAGYMQPDPHYGAVLTKNFRSDSLAPEIRFSKQGRAYHMDKLFTTNGGGYRGREFAVQKGPRTFRVVVLGDSTTMSIEVDDPETWPALLETELQQDASFLRLHGATRVEVINAAVGGWRSLEGLLRLEQEIQHLQPDLILVAFNWNDFGKAMKGHDPESVIYPKKRWWQAVKIFENLWIRHIISLDYDPDYIGTLRSGLLRDAPWARSFISHLLAMQRIASQIKAPMMTVNLPGLCRKQSADSGELELFVAKTRVTRLNCPLWAELKDFMTVLFRDTEREHGLRVIDVHGWLEPVAGPERLELFVDEMHMTARGTKEAAHRVAFALTH